MVTTRRNALNQELRTLLKQLPSFSNMNHKNKKSQKIGTDRRQATSLKLASPKRGVTIARTPSNATGVADITTVRLKYITSYVDFTASVSYYGHVFRLNSLFDPDYTGVGAQPLGFDQWAALYGSYRVMATRAKMTVASTASAAIPMVFGFYPSTDANTETTLDNAVMKPRSAYKVASWVGTAQNSIQRKFSMNEVLGQTPEQYRTQPETAALVSANPGTQVYLNMYAFNLNGTWSATAANNPTLIFELEFDVEFFFRVNIDESFRLLREVRLAYPQVTAKDIVNALKMAEKIQKLQ
jgi:hypothetical protein